MRREKRFAEQQQRYLAQREERRQRKHKNSLPGVDKPLTAPGADAAAVDGKSRRYETQTAAAARNSSPERVIAAKGDGSPAGATTIPSAGVEIPSTGVGSSRWIGDRCPMPGFSPVATFQRR